MSCGRYCISAAGVMRALRGWSCLSGSLWGLLQKLSSHYFHWVLICTLLSNKPSLHAATGYVSYLCQAAQAMSHVWSDPSNLATIQMQGNTVFRWFEVGCTIWADEPNRCEPNQSTYRQHLPKVCLQHFYGQSAILSISKTGQLKSIHICPEDSTQKHLCWTGEYINN